MSGYTPLFGSLTTGTLCGKWPDIGLWAIVLSLSDRGGIVDVTPDYLARVTGIPIDEVVACMKRFCEPDQYSRTATSSGARLELLDTHRNWGWRVINKGIYREKARLMNRDAERTASGKDAERKRVVRSKTPDVPMCPPMSPEIPPSDTESETDTNTEKRGESVPRGTSPRAPRSATRLPDDFGLTPERSAYAVSQKVDPQRTFENFRDHWNATSGARARKHDWDAAWRMWCRKEADWKAPNGRTPPVLSNDAAWAEAKTAAQAIGFRDPMPAETVTAYAYAVKQARDAPPKTPLSERRGLAGLKRVGAT